VACLPLRSFWASNCSGGDVRDTCTKELKQMVLIASIVLFILQPQMFLIASIVLFILQPPIYQMFLIASVVLFTLQPPIYLFSKTDTGLFCFVFFVFVYLGMLLSLCRRMIHPNNRHAVATNCAQSYIHTSDATHKGILNHCNRRAAAC